MEPVKHMKHIVGFSGGIDSQATARWVLNRFPHEDVVLLNSNVGGHEHPLTIKFIEQYSREVHPVVVVTPIVADMGRRGLKEGSASQAARSQYADTDILTFPVLAKIKGRFPSTKCQFCTEHLKLAPAHRWMKENLAGQEWRRYAGVRRDESKRRAGKMPVMWDDYYNCELHHPIVDWTKQMCFDYVKLHGEPINPLYTMGFNRVGCAPCINSGKKDVLAWAQRFPEMIDKVRQYEKEVGRTFFPPMVPGKEINWVDEVVEWSKTVYGGKQYSLEILYERSSCESDYGLCE